MYISKLNTCDFFCFNYMNVFYHLHIYIRFFLEWGIVMDFYKEIEFNDFKSQML